MRYLPLLFCAGLLVLFGCVTDQGKAPNQFGAQYDLLQTSALPALVDDSLALRVGYGGCTRNHVFVLQYSIGIGSMATLWLFKETSDQSCDMYVEETRIFSLPNELRNRRTILLIGPSDKRFTLHR